jgi:transposase
MRRQSSLTTAQRMAALDLSEEGFGYYAVASKLNVSAKAARSLRERFMVRGRSMLENKPTRQTYSFEFKLALVRQFLNGEGTQPEMA